MEIKKSWTASSKKNEDSEFQENLVLLAGSWDTGIEVTISNPTEICNGPIIHKINKRENV